MDFVVVAHWCVEPPRLRTRHLQTSFPFTAALCEIGGSFLIFHASGVVASGTTLNRSGLVLARCGPNQPHPPSAHVLAMKTERFAGHNEAREALVLAVAGVTAIMLIANLLLLILY
jgi:hypothetical protein